MIADNLMDLSLQKLTRALSLKQQINALEERLFTLFGGTRAPTSRALGKSRKKARRRPMSAASRAKLRAAAKARWANRRAGGPTAAATKTRGGLTAAGRKKLSDAMKARWAARKSGDAKKKSKPPTGNRGTSKK
jgi:hypothetical protein